MTAAITLPINMWSIKSADNVNRINYTGNGATYFHSGNTAETSFSFKNNADTTEILTISNTGDTKLTGILTFNNIVANRVISLYDAAIPNNFQYVGFGANSGLVLSCFGTSDSFKFNVGTSTLAANTIMTLTGSGNLGIGTINNIVSRITINE